VFASLITRSPSLTLRGRICAGGRNGYELPHTDGLLSQAGKVAAFSLGDRAHDELACLARRGSGIGDDDDKVGLLPRNTGKARPERSGEPFGKTTIAPEMRLHSTMSNG
jgi:hypothetical protein